MLRGLISPWMMPRCGRSSITVWKVWALTSTSRISSAISTARCGSIGPRADEFGKVFAFDVFHGDVEITFALADIEDLGDAAAGFALGELVLQDCAAAFGGDDVDAVAVSAGIDQFEADLPVEHGIVGEEDAAHAAAGEFADDLVTAEEFGVHQRRAPKNARLGRRERLPHV